MADILKEIKKILPNDKVSDICFEAANIVVYTKDKEYFFDNKGTIKQVVDEFKKRVELRPDPSITLDPEKSKKIIEKLISEEAGISEIIFDPQRSRVIIHTEKPGLAIGKQGSILTDIRKKTLWVPLIKRTPAIKSQLISDIRNVLYQNSEERRKFLDRVGHRIYDGWIREKKNEWVRLTYLGSGREVGRSCIMLQTPESRILLDCGLSPGIDADTYPFLEIPEFNVNEIDAIIITHSHFDHTGLIPILIRYGYKGPIYCTAPTRDVMSLILLDSVKIAVNEGKTPLYNSDEVKEMVKQTICLDYEEVTDITPDVRLTLYNSGHILGSAMAHLHIGNGLHNLVYTGDIKVYRTKLLEGANTKFPRLETMIIESTYGGKDDFSPNRNDVDDRLKDIIKTTIARGGKLLMPVLASGKGQEIMIIIEEMMRNKEIPEIPVWIDGMVWDITAIHTAYPEYLNSIIRKQIFHKDNNPFLSHIFKKVGSQKERKQLIEDKGPCIILATSGMLTGGPSVQYLKELANDPRHSLVFSCYQPENTLGRRIKNGEKDFIFKENGKQEIVELKLEVHRSLEISGHADRKELMSFVGKVQPKPKKIIVDHGESSKCLDLASSIHKIYRIETVAPKNLETIRLK
ncbi:beta-CASP ribonuclease aCPSF1 [Candidatus Woesearchaeota archaeon]|nr:beta-CASP ribonuclease aCPSF1 [Candidatus Woesearchaeota archaeon]